MGILKFILIILTSVNSIKCQQSCSNIAQYSSTFFQTYGIVEVSNVPLQEFTFIDVHLSVAAKLTVFSDWKITLINQDAYSDIINGRSLQLKFVPLITNPLPIVTGVFLNKHQICSNPPARGGYITTIKLTYKHIISNIPQHLLSNSYNPVTQNYYFNYQNQQPQTTQDTYSYYQTQSTHPPTPPPVRTFPTTTTTPRQTTHASITSKFEDKKSQSYVCGIRRGASKATSLIIGGKKAERNDFPWLAAFHYRSKGFICGGTIVSTRIIVTAAHCVQDKQEVEKKDPYDSTFFLGKYHLKDLTEVNCTFAGVNNFVIHPHWDIHDERYEGDIAIAVLLKEIKIQDNIVPLCIWPQTTNYNDLVNEEGLIAGWGLTSNGSISDVTMFVTLPVVDKLTCQKSNDGFSKLLARTTFCVGNGSGRSPCNGDSGGAFAVKNTQDNKYYFRGIVSAGLFNEEKSCDNTNYAVFTDAAQYTDWIRGYINTNG